MLNNNSNAIFGLYEAFRDKKGALIAIKPLIFNINKPELLNFFLSLRGKKVKDLEGVFNYSFTQDEIMVSIQHLVQFGIEGDKSNLGVFQYAKANDIEVGILFYPGNYSFAECVSIEDFHFRLSLVRNSILHAQLVNTDVPEWIKEAVYFDYGAISIDDWKISPYRMDLVPIAITKVPPIEWHKMNI